jgi:hypothetical protein
MHLKAGDWVEVRSKEEILRSLDKDGRLDGLPFMPQMFQYCGQKFQVYARAHKTCDTVNPIRGRRLANGIHLDLRCDGKAYGGCQAACLLFWKEEWLKGLESEAIGATPLSKDGAQCTEQDVQRATHSKDSQGETVYSCQATELPRYTTKLSPWDPRQYVEDYTSGNVPLSRILAGFIYVTYYHLALPWKGRIGRPSRWLYDFVQKLRGGVPFPRKRGTLPAGQPAPMTDLNLQPGELVRVKSYAEILSTLRGSWHKGLWFDAEMVPFCGREFRVRTRVATFIDEKTGKMTKLKTPAVILESVYCQSRYSHCRMFCPRSIYSWWREAWLERVPEGGASAQTTGRPAASVAGMGHEPPAGVPGKQPELAR